MLCTFKTFWVKSFYILYSKYAQGTIYFAIKYATLNMSAIGTHLKLSFPLKNINDYENIEICLENID